MNQQLVATFPPADLAGLDPSWSRHQSIRDLHGVKRTFHYLDSGLTSDTQLTLVCVHGNPTWSYLWRNFLLGAPSNIRVIAVDHLGMGYSDRTPQPRTLAERIDDLTRFVAALTITTPIASAAHDWGGPISLGWVESEISQKTHDIAGVVLFNTAVHQPEQFRGPGLIRLARARTLLAPVTERSSAFVWGTRVLSGKKMSADTARGFRAPYGSRERRVAIKDFVADIPFEPDHVSRRALDGVAAGLSLLAQTPVLLAWGPNDPVFSDLYLRDFLERIPHAQVHRYEGASHLVTEDAPRSVSDALRWIEQLADGGSDSRALMPTEKNTRDVDLGKELHRRAAHTPDHIALTVMDSGKAVTWEVLSRRVHQCAAGLRAEGVKTGDRVALLVPPGPELIALVYACWELGASIILADSGLGARGIFRAIRGAHPDHIISIPRARPLTQLLSIPGLRLTTKDLPRIVKLGHAFKDSGSSSELGGDLLGAIVFTSGSTGPAKGVRYSRGRVLATVEKLSQHYSLHHNDVIIAAFAPWSVFGPALGVASVLPAMDLGSPSSLTYPALIQAVTQARGTLLWASPAALRNVVDTAPMIATPSAQALPVRLILSAGAPVPPPLLTRVQELFPDAQVRTPYGMTEALPITDVTLPEILDEQGGQGVLVGRPLPETEIAIAPWKSPHELTHEPNVMGEIIVRATHMRNGYLNLEFTQQISDRFPGWHCTRDVGHLDSHGRLWIEGRLSHVIDSSNGPITPVPLELAAETSPQIAQAAAVGVGPAGSQVVVLVVIREKTGRHLTETQLQDHLRSLVHCDIAAVLQTTTLPTDIRHNAKLDREKISSWAERTLAGKS